jgi:primosomal protein N'
MYCSYCGSMSHNSRFCPSTFDGSANRRNLRCSYCGAHDHDVRACPKTWAGSVEHVRDPDHYIKDYRKL